MDAGGVADILRRGGAPTQMVDKLFRAIQILDEYGVKHLLVGGMAALYWGRSRIPSVGREFVIILYG